MLNDFSCGVIPYRVNRDGVREFLLIQHNAGHWAFPKGHPEKGETDLQAATRELAEETGLTEVEIDPHQPFDEHYRFTKKSGKQVHKHVVYFLGKITTEQPVVLQEQEVSAFAWGDAEQTRQRITFDEGRALFDQVLASLISG